MTLLRKAFIRFKEGIPAFEPCYVSYVGFKNLGVEVSTFENIEDVKGELQIDTLVHGGVGDVHAALRALNCAIPTFGSRVMHPRLQALAGRSITSTTLNDVRSSPDAWPVFVKPIERKLFNGHVVSSFKSLLETCDLPGDTEVTTQKPLTFTSEHRAFIHNSKIVDVRRYAGSYALQPSIAYIDLVVNTINELNCNVAAYAIDVGTLKDGTTTLVELNDSFALGTYGLPWRLYVPMIEQRWVEMMMSGRWTL